VIDAEDEVLYFTNDPRYAGTLPKTIDHWREPFREKPVVYMSRKAQSVLKSKIPPPGR
jgi:hypothetical protein